MSDMRALLPAHDSSIRNPSRTIMLADVAFLDGDTLIEYSFVEAPVFEVWGGWPATPSIHFRHNRRANVAWVDGRVTSEPMGFTRGASLEAANIGFVGPYDDNRLYDRN